MHTHKCILSFLQSYLSNRAYIVTQGPLPDTRRDFFKMIFDRDVVAIVMLTGNEDSNSLEHEAGEGNDEVFVQCTITIIIHDNII